MSQQLTRGENAVALSTRGLPSKASLFLLIAILLAVFSRIFILAWFDFPLNDGGPFVAVIEQTAEIFPFLPTNFTWNGLTIPFAYPPLSLWVGALLRWAGVDAIEILRVLPVVTNIAYLLLFSLLLLRAGHSRAFTAVALLFLFTAFRSFEWLVMGGGLSRGAGSVFLMLSLLAAGAPGPQKRAASSLRMGLSGLAVGAAILSHLEWGLLSAAAVVVSRAFTVTKFRDFVRGSFIAGGAAFALVSPWLLWLLETHGLEPLASASATSGWGPLGSALQLADQGARASIYNPFVLIGGLALLRRREPFWIVFMLLCSFLTPRHGPTPLTLSFAIFAAHGVKAAYDFLRSRVGRQRALAGATAAVLFLGSLQAYRSIQNSGSVRPLPPQVRSAMAWIARTHSGASFLVFTGEPWWIDKSAEWFPTLSRARSVATVQGREWLPDREFERTVAFSEKLRTSSSCAELRSLISSEAPVAFIWAEDRIECFPSQTYEKLYQNKVVTIFRHAARRGAGEPGLNRLSAQTAR